MAEYSFLCIQQCYVVKFPFATLACVFMFKEKDQENSSEKDQEKSSDQPCDRRVDHSFRLVYFPHYETLTFISCLSKYKPLTFPTFPRCSGILNLMTLLHCFSTTKFTTASLDLRQKKKKQKVLKMAKCIPQPVYTAFVRCNKKTFYV